MVRWIGTYAVEHDTDTPWLIIGDDEGTAQGFPLIIEEREPEPGCWDPLESAIVEVTGELVDRAEEPFTAIRVDDLTDTGHDGCFWSI